MTHTLPAAPRTVGARSILTDIRTSRKIPAVIYGPEVKPVSITIEYNPFEKIFHEAGTSTLVTLTVEETPHIVVVKDVALDPLTNRFMHVDFFEVSMKKEMEVPVAIRFVGESPAVKNEGGTLIKVKDTLTIRCLPKDLISALEVSLDALHTFDDVIAVGDIALPPGVEFVEEAEEIIAKVAAPLTEEQLKALEAENVADVTKVEVVGKKEGEAAEGATDGEADAKEKTPAKAEKK